MNPIIKYTGGKRQEIKYFEDWLNVDYERYVEPFVGGGAVYFHLKPENALINDLNTQLINFYKDVAFKRDELITELKTMKNEEEFYYKIRQMYNDEIPKEFSDAAIFAYINRTAFSGMIRHSKGKKDENGNWLVKPKFNIPYGRYKSFKPWDFLTVEASELLQRTDIRNEDFSTIFEELTDKDFVFLDPPYMSTFDKYLPDGFGEDQQIKLAECFKNSPAKILAIISDMGIIRELYKDYIKGEYDKNYAINVRNRMKDVTEAKHLIIANYDI